MAKKIVFCSDGTWNHPNSSVMVSEGDTNVYKLYKALAVTATQVTFYDDGVGSDGLPADRLLGGAFGVGLFQKIKDGYTAVAHVYEPGDEVFVFGFSRGAYTARSLVGMIGAVGLPAKNFDMHMVDVAFEAYRNKDQRATLLAQLSQCNLEPPIIKMVGVWDTVGALGIPGALFGAPSLIYGFLDTGLNPRVQHAYHALAIDERRSEFRPTLWTGPFAPGQVVQQVWFPGVHCDVGGGYPECGLSDITLGWMLQKAMSNGLEVLPAAANRYLNIDPKHALDQVHESWNLLWGFPERRSLLDGSSISNSVQIRIAHESAYRPANVRIDPTGQLSLYALEAVLQMPAAAAAAGTGRP